MTMLSAKKLFDYLFDCTANRWILTGSRESQATFSSNWLVIGDHRMVLPYYSPKSFFHYAAYFFIPCLTIETIVIVSSAFLDDSCSARLDRRWSDAKELVIALVGFGICDERGWSKDHQIL